MANGQGTVTFDFGSAPGTNVVTTTVTGLTTISGTSNVEIYLMGTDSTATHNAYEHSFLPMLGGWSATVTTVTAGTGFVAQAASALRLTGTIKCHYVWTD